MKILPLTSVVFGLITALASTSFATVLYDDQFTRGTAETPLALHGTSPTTYDSSLPAHSYLASTSWTSDGSVASVSSGSVSAFLPTTISTGYVYTLSLTLDLSTTDANFFGFGFTSTNLYNSTILSSLPLGSAGLLFRGNGEVVSRADSTILATGHTGETTLSLILDTTETAWTLNYEINGTAVGATYTFTTNPTISYIGFGNFSTARGYVDDFTLTVVPEPAVLHLSLASAFAFLFLKRRRSVVA